jgi:hypothetical protein
MGYGLNSHGSIPGRDKKLSLFYIAQAGSGAHPTSYTSDGQTFLGGGQRKKKKKL